MKYSKFIKRLLSFTLALVLLAMAAAPALAASKASGAYVVATTGSDKLRVHGADGSVIGKLKRGDVVAYKGTKKGWWLVEYRGGKGYVDKSYLVSVASTPSAVYTSVDNLWVRTKPKTNATKYGKLKPGKKVIITGQKGTWVCINNKSWSGWVPAKYLKRVK